MESEEKQRMEWDQTHHTLSLRLAKQKKPYKPQQETPRQPVSPSFRLENDLSPQHVVVRAKLYVCDHLPPQQIAHVG